ncbi:EscU/YscU/HrcU family type III secretion system export apparatus switch protein [Tepidimonas taiwanensis]|uniref:Flagellar biosynthetic protein FlhB n=1 Tax=Tepidimonas taiwanensis TaxID=307486 RepID=A0A554XCG2_9BURK|nr:flagellar type III secretion system protein FlhB [Tepidimonas taiwanensis]MCX7693237.1 EscU/YscU/HrcU family type III secretion system export apparatus switch protein [Tepidimonas taiwanensis]MDM7464229.1 flagellar type III secretion system protein FlhB [Tepidimonas taiwanensis]TSE33531.1 Flagellar biosynthetic protein FlhB [Tepidimonas taiwanensis]UBQ05768.1 EscU/YscU/HrcU family type III secretion system export apparatus switch protein [Tepidimonas taiwanensis]
MESTQDKNQPATPRRLQKAREEGQIPRSRDLTHLAVLGGGAVLLWATLPWVYERLRAAVRAGLRFDAERAREPAQMLQHLGDGLWLGLGLYLPLGLAVLVIVVLALLAAGSYALSTKPLMPDLSKIGLISGFKRLFSRQQAFEVLKLLAITALIAVLGAWYVQSHIDAFASLLLRPLESALVQTGEWFAAGVAWLLAVVLLVAAVDVPLQQYLYRHRLRMSLQEVKDEHKETEGNPQIKSARRQRAREIAYGQSIRRVPEADVVVMNPTHYAVALRYDEHTMAAPHVIAKGADLLALRIRDVAREAKVPVLEAPMLARALYAHTELDEPIPAALFTAVAQVLAWVYRLRAALRGQGPMPRPPRPDVPVELDPLHGRAPT